MKKVLFLTAVMTTTAFAATMTGMLSKTDTAFVPKAAMGNNFEIKAAQLALKMGKAAGVKSYAQRMIADHTKLGADVKAAVMKADASMMLPSGVSPKQQAMLNKLAKAGTKFDSEYKADMTASHAETYALFQSYTKAPDANPDLKTVITGALPTVKMHLDDAKKLPGMGSM